VGWGEGGGEVGGGFELEGDGFEGGRMWELCEGFVLEVSGGEGLHCRVIHMRLFHVVLVQSKIVISLCSSPLKRAATNVQDVCMLFFPISYKL